MAGPQICKVGDLVTGTCQVNVPGHPRQFVGTWTTGSSNLTTGQIGVITVGDIGVTDCGHTFVAAAGSSQVSNNGIGVVRVGDPVTVVGGGYGVAATGADNTGAQ
jgi:uncharacterized Zn-binding protein involved in type VI secretion